MKRCFLAVFCLGWQFAALAGDRPTKSPVHSPWWDDCAVFIQSGDAAQAARLHANAVMNGAGDDPAWGAFSERARILTQARNTALLRAEGIKALGYDEAFGETTTFIAQLKRDASGALIKAKEDPALTNLFATFWSWEHYDGTGEIHWIGLPDYFTNNEAVAPWTRNNPRYGCPMATYPDGRPAEGRIDATDPRTDRLYDACCSKNVNGQVTFDYGYRPHLPLAGLVKTEGATSSAPDPGYTPEEWAAMKKARYTGLFNAGKDTACPIWIDYARASVRQQLDAGIDGLWIDNYSPWDSFNMNPVTNGTKIRPV